MLNELIREPHLHVGILTLIADRDARLDFIQVLFALCFDARLLV